MEGFEFVGWVELSQNLSPGPWEGDGFRSAQPILALVESGNTVVVIEHILEVIKTADWIIDLGPEGGDSGSEIVAARMPKAVVKVKRSYTGAFIAPVLGRRTHKTGAKTRTVAAE